MTRSSIFHPRSSILDPRSLRPRYPHVVNARLDEACASGVRRLDEDSNRPSGELAEIHRGGGKGCVILSGSSKLLKYRGRRSAVHDTHAEKVGGRGIVQVGQVIGEGQGEGGSPLKGDCRRLDGCCAAVYVIGADRSPRQPSRDQVVDSADSGSLLHGSARSRRLGVATLPPPGRRGVGPIRVGRPSLVSLEVVEEDRRRPAAAAILRDVGRGY